MKGLVILSLSLFSIFVDIHYLLLRFKNYLSRVFLHIFQTISPTTSPLLNSYPCNHPRLRGDFQFIICGEERYQKSLFMHLIAQVLKVYFPPLHLNIFEGASHDYNFIVFDGVSRLNLLAELRKWGFFIEECPISYLRDVTSTAAISS